MEKERISEMSNNKWGIAHEEAKVLKRLEDLTGKKIAIVDKIRLHTIGVKVEDKKVIALGLSKCGLTTLPDSFGHLKSLEVLWLAENQLTLPNSFFQLKLLQILVLNFNKLKTLPDSFSQLKSLEWLSLSSNKL
ncbi:MAG: hypothetical protein GF329_12145, partial [Candidatus Lokiarchaeota archaeon]|nr:hypothetical protein [Candidatus Lokiarchaeota archaeon]